MSTDVTDLTSLDVTTVQNREQLLIQMLTEAFPTIDFTRGGVLQQLMVHPDAVLNTLNQQEIQNLKDSMSLNTLEANPSIADSTIVDAVLSNYMVTRTAATSTHGVLAIVVSQLITTPVRASMQFVANGRVFSPDKAYTGVASAGLVVDDSTRLMTKAADGNYWFTINVTERTTGGTAVAQGVEFAVNQTLDNFVRAYAMTDFVAGTAAQDNASLVAEMANGVSVRAVADRQSINSLLKAEFPGIVDMSIIGYGDMEMSRDRGNIFGIGCGGKSDIYIRTSAIPATLKFTAMVGAGSPTVYNIPVAPTLAPGFYRAEKITPVDPSSSTTGRYTYTEPADRGIYVPVDQEFLPLINTPEQARYTPYQGAASFAVIDTATQAQHYAYVNSIYGSTPNATLTVYKDGVLTNIIASQMLADIHDLGYRVYDVYLSYTSNLGSVQDYINLRDHRAPVADYLVKGAIPCFTGVDVTVGYKANQQTPSISALQDAISSAVNAVTFDAVDLQAATIIQAVTDLLGNFGYVLTPLTLRGDLLLPDGTTQLLTGTDALVIPDLPSVNVSRSVVAYYATSSAINVTLQAV